MYNSYAVRESSKIRRPRFVDNGNQDLSVSIRYINRMSTRLILRERNGMSYFLPLRNPREQKGELSIVVTIAGKAEHFKEAANVLNAENMIDGTERSALLDALNWGATKASRERSLNFTESSIEYVLTEEDLTNDGGTVYLSDLDILVSSRDICQARHPMSREMRDQVQLGDLLPKATKNSLIFILKAVDNNRHQQHSSKFINVAGDIYELPVERDFSMPSGVHLIARVPVCDPNMPSVTGHTRMLKLTFEEGIKKFSLQRSVEDARWGGSITEVSKNQIEETIARLKVEDARIKAEMREQERVHELQMQEARIAHEREKAQWEQQLAEKQRLLKEKELELTELRNRQLELKTETDLVMENARLKTRGIDVATNWLGSATNITKALSGAVIAGIGIYVQIKALKN